jgi:Cu-Zn family superoxide dismutase
MRRTLLPAAAVLLALTSCASEEDGELREDLATVTADGAAPRVPDSGEGEGPEEEEPGGPVLEPAEVATELVDREGTVVGSARFVDGEDGTTVEVVVNGLAEGFHGMGLYGVGVCEPGIAPADDPAQTVAFSSVGDLLATLPPVLVLANGVGELTTLVAPTPELEELLADDGTALVIEEPVAAPAGDAPGDLPGPGEVTPPAGSRVACGAVGG